MTAGTASIPDTPSTPDTASAPEAAVWRPIATAPADEAILVFSARWGAMIATYRSEFDAWFSRMQCPASLDGTEGALITHWMPLPARPDPALRLASSTPSPATGLPMILARFIERVSARQAA